MSDAFKPSVADAKSKLGSTPVVHRSHPGGAKGAGISLNEVAKRIREGRLDPRVRAWAIRTIKAAGEPKSARDRTQALLDGLRAAAMYIPDPVNAEFMQAAHLTLCLDDKGLCFKGGDCDDLSVALGAAAMSVGIPVFVVGQAYDNSGIPSHVLIGIETSNGRLKADPSSTYPVGRSFPSTKEWWIDPMEAEKNHVGELSGDFVGVGTLPAGWCGTKDGTVGATALPGLDWLPPNLIFRLATGDIRDLVLGDVKADVEALELANKELQISMDEIIGVRKVLRPNDPYDDEPKDMPAIRDIGSFPPKEKGLWTVSMEKIAAQHYLTGQTLTRIGREAMNGERTVFVAEDRSDILISKRPGDSWSLLPVARASGGGGAGGAGGGAGSYDIIYAFFEPDGTVISGFAANSGRALTGDEVYRMMTGPQTGVGAWPAVAIVGAIAAALSIAAVSISVYYANKSADEKAMECAREATSKATIECATAGKCTPEDVQKILGIQGKARVELEKAKAETESQKGLFGGVAGIIKWVVIGGVVAGGFVLLAPTVRKAIEDFAERQKHPVLRGGHYKMLPRGT